MDGDAERQPQSPVCGGTSVHVTHEDQLEHSPATFAMLPDLQFRSGDVTPQPNDIEGGNTGVTTFRGALRGAIRGAASATLLNLEESHESAAAAAARYRLSSATHFDIQAVAQWLEKALPFIAILLVVFIRKHIIGIFLYAWLAAVLWKANDVVRNQAAAKGDSSVTALVGIAALLALHPPAVLWVLQNRQLWRSFALLTPLAVPTVWDAVFRAVMVDCTVRACGMIVKVGLVLVCRCDSSSQVRRRGQRLTVLECTLLFYRALITTPVWFQFFEDTHLGSILTSSCTGLYLLFKCSVVLERLMQLMRAGKALLLLGANDHPFGKRALLEETCEAGSAECSICQENMRDPTQLACKHMFCNECIGEWFERSSQCPICRAVIKPPGMSQYGDGSTALLPQIF